MSGVMLGLSPVILIRQPTEKNLRSWLRVNSAKHLGSSRALLSAKRTAEILRPDKSGLRMTVGSTLRTMRGNHWHSQSCFRENASISSSKAFTCSAEGASA